MKQNCWKYRFSSTGSESYCSAG